MYTILLLRSSMSKWMNKIVIFDLDGTLALIDNRRDISMVDGKRDWDIFFDPKNIDMDLPNHTVIDMLNMINDTDRYQIFILSGRSDITRDATIDWLNRYGVDNVAMVFDDRQQVVDMWRSNGLTTFQVADGDF